jgi:hypothetical protein
MGDPSDLGAIAGALKITLELDANEDIVLPR